MVQRSEFYFSRYFGVCLVASVLSIFAAAASAQLPPLEQPLRPNTLSGSNQNNLPNFQLPANLGQSQGEPTIPRSSVEAESFSAGSQAGLQPLSPRLQPGGSPTPLQAQSDFDRRGASGNAGGRAVGTEWDNSEQWGQAVQMASATQADANDTNSNTALGPLEEFYAKWWREVLSVSEVAGQPLELQTIIRAASWNDRVPVIREYWRLGEAIMAIQVHRETLEIWQQATANMSQQSLVRSVSDMLKQQIEHAEATVESEQAHLGLWMQRIGLPPLVRPVDAPFLGPYDTKLEQLQQRGLAGTEAAVLAYQVDSMKKEILSDARVIDWAEEEWQRARSAADIHRMAAMIQLRQTAYLLWIGRVTRYNDRIAQYAYSIAGPNRTIQEQLSMLLRQPIVDGRMLVDVRTDPWFRSGTSESFGMDSSVRPVNFEQFPTSNGPFQPTAGNWQPARVR